MVNINNVSDNYIKKTKSSPSTNKTAQSVNREYDSILNGEAKTETIKKFGITHYRYEDCKISDLTAVDKCRVHKDCAAAFKAMKEAAKKDGANLRIVSGYRSSQYQKQVFKSKFNGKYPTSEQMKGRLKYSAPSGYSEHHTGLAIDINVTEEYFKDSKEYKWLLENASKFGFEMSFPEGNAQGLGFEPWHWRYIGKNGEYKHIFEQARQNEPKIIKK